MTPVSETDLAAELVRLIQLGPGPERWDALRALQELGAEAAAAVPALVGALSDPDIGFRTQAVLTLVGIGEPAVPPLLEAFAAGDEDLRKAIIVTLGRIGQPAACAIPLLESLLEDPALDRVAAQALDRIRPVRVADLVPHFRRTFFQALGLCAGCALVVGALVLLAWSGQALQGGGALTPAVAAALAVFLGGLGAVVGGHSAGKPGALAGLTGCGVAGYLLGRFMGGYAEVLLAPLQRVLTSP